MPMLAWNSAQATSVHCAITESGIPAVSTDARVLCVTLYGYLTVGCLPIPSRGMNMCGFLALYDRGDAV